MKERIKVRYIGKDGKGFVKNEIYDAYKLKSNLKNKNNILCVIDKFGEEYAYPSAWFEIIT